MSKKNKNKNKKNINYNEGDNIHDNVNRKQKNWFPGHMNKAIRQIKERMCNVDIVLELRDARSPLATGNTFVNKILGKKSRLIVINKTNLADPKIINLWKVWFEKQEVPFIFINCFDKNSLKLIKINAKRLIPNKKKLKMMIIGLPNTGKSTIINRLANRNATKVANKPGQTQQQLWVNVDEEIEIFDTPGVMPPKIDIYQHVLWLSALHAIPDTIIKPEDSACFIVEHLLKVKSKIFIKHYQLSSLDLDLLETLNQIGKLRGCIKRKGQYDYDRIYKIILMDFRKGVLGQISFGLPPIIKDQASMINH